ncbi:hypothetical protein MUY35_15835 [Aliiroseovarius sp. S1339]|uniref:hypothetical protein n=1 Tax=Aliiroseovarius sp. S1339 TaxID=2936990 RepID=UPI0020C09344|nr:hypothetical protein [Aliiroseovarius sp. S1339]MCK8465330.1 hypothetical protein [Aliiroseovarius sp. S1339]
MKHSLFTVFSIGFLAACETVAPATDLPLMGGYRDVADQCQRVGESAATVEYLDHTADLVACPAEYEGLGVFTHETGGVEVARIDGWVLFSVSTEG